MSNANKKILLTGSLVAGFIIDRLTKLFFLKTDYSKTIWPHNLSVQLHTNSDIVFGWLQISVIYYLFIFLIIFILFHLLWQEYRKNNLFQIWIIGLIGIGALSNLLDRIKYGGVIDWLNVEWWSIFNLADVYIVGGALLWAISLRCDDKKISEM